ncbi:MAG: hypothetical protein H0U29_04910 [Acidimicrobiia bacterium]|nr:hypothetical protein [Acidimicrobiia bacterium]
MAIREHMLRPPRPADVHSRQAGSVAILLAVLTANVLAACGGGDDKPAEPLKLGRAPAEPGKSIDLDIPLDASGFFAFNQWPQACEILTDADIEAVLPQTEEVKRTPDDQDIKIIGDVPQTVTAVGATCTYKLDLPDAGLRPDDPAIPPSIRLTVESAGSPEVVEQNFSGDVNDPTKVPGGECYVRDKSAGVNCFKGQLAFQITSRFPHQDLDNVAWTDRYVVGGKTTTFTDDGTDKDAGFEEFTKAEEFRRDALDVELAEIVLAKY